MRPDHKIVIVCNGKDSLAFTDLEGAEAFISDPWGTGWRLLNEYRPFTPIYGSVGHALDVMQEGCAGDIDDDGAGDCT